MDLGIHRLVVRGPAREVEAFRTCARGDHPGDYWTVSRQSKYLQLSFQRLKAVGKAILKMNLDPPNEPIDLIVEKPTMLKHGLVELVYKFQIGYGGEPRTFLAKLSQAFPHLCFVFGSVEPSISNQDSCFILRGKRTDWHLPERRGRVLAAKVEKLMNIEGTTDSTKMKLENELLEACVEADWAMLDEVVHHWDKKAEKTLAMIARDLHTESKRQRKSGVKPASKKRKKR